MSATPCGQAFGNFLLKRSEHLDTEILQDWFPSDDAWVGHVSVGQYKAYDGVSHTYDRFHMAFPDLSGGRQALDNSSCGASPCDWTEKVIGYGMDRFSYALGREAYASDIICWDQNLTIDQAVEKWGFYVEGLKAATKMINSRWFKLQALVGATALDLCGSTRTTVPVSLDSTFTELDTTGLYPTSVLSIPYLEGFTSELQLQGYHKKMMSPVPMFKLITDLDTERDLRVANPTLSNLYRHSDFVKANGDFYKLGATGAIGNFATAVDFFPMRFNREANGKLKRIFPYSNTNATVGIKQTVDQKFINAAYQVDFIWHEMAMKILVMDARPLHKDMPFLVRDFGGKWRFAGPGSDSFIFNKCAVDNKRRNKGVWYADFESATKWERPELYKAILSLRNVNCSVDIAPCRTQVGYPTQSYASSNTVCPLTFVPNQASNTHYKVAANTATCNGIALVHGAIDAVDLAALIVALTAQLGTLGTWALDASNNVTLSGSTCQTFNLPFLSV